MIQMMSEKDIGAQRIAPGIKSQEYEIGTNITVLSMTDMGCAVGLGDGRVLSFTGQEASELVQHDGAVTTLIATPKNQIISTGQDGLIFCAEEGKNTEMRAADGAWIEVSAYHSPKGIYAFAVGNTVVLCAGTKEIASYFDHPSTITGLAFSPSGNEIAVSHYDGISIWPIGSDAQPRILSWKGSIVGVSWSPNGRYIVASTQDREIHIWDMVSGKDFRFGGFKGKVRQVGWSNCSNYMVTSGADVIAAWPVAGDPGSFPPKEIGYVFSASVSAIAIGEKLDRVAGGFTDGSVLIGNIRNGEALIARVGTGAEVTQMQWNQDQSELLYGTRDGIIGTLTLDL